jgi:hypothetical protein
MKFLFVIILSLSMSFANKLESEVVDTVLESSKLESSKFESTAYENSEENNPLFLPPPIPPKVKERMNITYVLVTAWVTLLGLVAFFYGKIRQEWTPMIYGIFIILVPYFIANPFLIFLGGTAGFTLLYLRLKNS